MCELAQDAALLCRQCGCSLADAPPVRKDEYLRSNLLSSIKGVSVAQLRRVGAPEAAARPAPLSSLEAALSKTRRVVGQEDQAPDDDWD